MKNLRNSQGFSLLPILLLVFVVAIAGFVGFRVYDKQQNTKTVNISTSSTSKAANPSDQPINTVEDINKQQNVIDNSNIDADLDTTALDQDLNNLL